MAGGDGGLYGGGRRRLFDGGQTSAKFFAAPRARVNSNPVELAPDLRRNLSVHFQ